MTLIGDCVQGAGGHVVKVYGKETQSIRRHLKGWSQCSQSRQMLKLCSDWKRLKRWIVGPLRASRSVEGPARSVWLLQIHGAKPASSTYREAAVFQTAILIIDITVICWSIASFGFFFSGDRRLLFPHRGIFPGRISLRGPMRITPRHYVLINNANPRSLLCVCLRVNVCVCVLIQTPCFPKWKQWTLITWSRGICVFTHKSARALVCRTDNAAEDRQQPFRQRFQRHGERKEGEKVQTPALRVRVRARAISVGHFLIC